MSKMCGTTLGSFVLPLDRSSADASWAEAVGRRSSSESDSLMASSSVYASSLSCPLPLRPLFLHTSAAADALTASRTAESGTQLICNPHPEYSGLESWLTELRYQQCMQMYSCIPNYLRLCMVVCMGAKKCCLVTRAHKVSMTCWLSHTTPCMMHKKSLGLLTLLLFGLSCALVLALAELATLPWHPSCLCLASFA